MKYAFLKNFKNIAIAILICSTGALGYLYYESGKTNIEDRELIKQLREENLDLSQDVEIYKDKVEKVKNEIKSVKSKSPKVVYKKIYVNKRFISSAGKSSKHRSHYNNSKISYKKLYFQLKSECSKYKSGVKSRNKR